MKQITFSLVELHLQELESTPTSPQPRVTCMQLMQYASQTNNDHAVDKLTRLCETTLSTLKNAQAQTDYVLTINSKQQNDFARRTKPAEIMQAYTNPHEHNYDTTMQQKAQAKRWTSNGLPICDYCRHIGHIQMNCNIRKRDNYKARVQAEQSNAIESTLNMADDERQEFQDLIAQQHFDNFHITHEINMIMVHTDVTHETQKHQEQWQEQHQSRHPSHADHNKQGLMEQESEQPVPECWNHMFTMEVSSLASQPRQTLIRNQSHLDEALKSTHIPQITQHSDIPNHAQNIFAGHQSEITTKFNKLMYYH
ncbi:MAG: hypothetical protein GY820_08545 [Gammaproteobacteria bacterium]|nr:hypothetical protein [Gammaproteobacteria bacterium]